MDPIIGRGKKRRQAGVVPVGNKESDGRARPSVWGTRQVGAVPSSQDPHFTQKYREKDLQEQRAAAERVAASNPMHRGDVPREERLHAFDANNLGTIDKAYGGLPKILTKLSRAVTVVAVLYGWIVFYNQLVRHYLPEQVYFDLTSITFWKLLWEYILRGYLSNATFLEYTVAPVSGAIVGGVIVLLLTYKLLLPILNFTSKPFIWLAGKIINLGGIFDKIKTWRRSINKPRRAGTGFGDEHEPEQAFITPPMNNFREAAIVRREEQEKKEEDGDGEGDDTLSGAGGSVPGGGQSPNAIAAAMSGKMGGGNSV